MGITSAQATAIADNGSDIATMKTEQTTQDAAINLNTAKVGITSAQADAIVANTAKVSNATHTGDVTGATTLTIADDA